MERLFGQKWLIFLLKLQKFLFKSDFENFFCFACLSYMITDNNFAWRDIKKKQSLHLCHRCKISNIAKRKLEKCIKEKKKQWKQYFLPRCRLITFSSFDIVFNTFFRNALSVIKRWKVSWDFLEAKKETKQIWNQDFPGSFKLSQKNQEKENLNT